MLWPFLSNRNGSMTVTVKFSAYGRYGQRVRDLWLTSSHASQELFLGFQITQTSDDLPKTERRVFSSGDQVIYDRWLDEEYELHFK